MLVDDQRIQFLVYKVAMWMFPMNHMWCGPKGWQVPGKPVNTGNKLDVMRASQDQ